MDDSIDLAIHRFKNQLTKQKDKKMTQSTQKINSTQNQQGNRRSSVNLIRRETALRVKDLMSIKPFTVFEDDNLQFAEDMMQWRHFRHIPVVDDDRKLVGLITHRDLLKSSLSSLAKVSRVQSQKRNLRIPVQAVMQRNILSVSPNTSIEEAADMMLTNKFGCFPVVKKGKLIGIITEADFVRYVSHRANQKGE
jgi:CBS domain-containing membrane protein